MVTWGTTPAIVVEVTDSVPDPATMDSPADREAAERALAYMELEAGTPMREIALDRIFIGSCTNSRISDLREAASIVDGRKIASSLRGMVVPGSQQVKDAGRAGGARRGLQGGRLRVARVGLLGLPRHEPRHPQTRGALRVDLQPQLRGPPGRRRPYSPGQPEDGGRRRRRGSLRRHQGVGVMDPIDIIEGHVAVLDRADVDTDQIIPKQFLKRIERTGFGEFLFYDWFRIGRDRARAASDPGHGSQLRLGLLARARRLGAQGLRLRCRDRAVVLGHLLLQLHQERAAAGDPRRGALQGGRRRG